MSRVVDPGSTIVVLDALAGPDDTKSRSRLQTLVELIVGQDNEVVHRPVATPFADLDSPPSAAAQGQQGEEDDGYSSSFQVSIPDSSASTVTSSTALGTPFSFTKWSIRNRYYDAEVLFACLALPLAGGLGRPPTILPSSKNGADAMVEDHVLKAFEQATEGVPAIMLLIADAKPKEVYEAVLKQIASVVEGFDLAVSLAINVGAPLDPGSLSSSSIQHAKTQAARSREKADDLSELFAEHGWEYVDLNALAEESEDEDDDAGQLVSVRAGEEETTGLERVREALYAHTWPNLVRAGQGRRKQTSIAARADQASPKTQQQTTPTPWRGFSDSQPEQREPREARKDTDEEDGDELGEADGAAYIERLHARIRQASEQQSGPYGSMEDGVGTDNDHEEASSKRGWTSHDADDFGAFQDGTEAGPSSVKTSGAEVRDNGKASATDLGASWLNDFENGRKDTTSFASRFGPVPEANAVFASEGEARQASLAPRRGEGMSSHDDDDELDDGDRAVLAEVMPPQDEIDKLASELGRLAFPHGNPSNQPVRQRGPGGCGAKDAEDDADAESDPAFLEVMSNMASLRATMQTHQARIQTMEDPIAKRREALKFSLAFTQFLTGRLDEDDFELIGAELERQHLGQEGSGPAKG